MKFRRSRPACGARDNSSWSRHPVHSDKLGVSQPTATTHLQALARAGLVTSKRVGQWTFFKRDEAAIRAFKRQLSDEL